MYRVTLRSSPYYENAFQDESYALTPSQLAGIAAMATAMLGDTRDEIFEIRDRGLRRYDLDKLLRDSRSIVMEGEPVFDLTPSSNENWLDRIREEANLYNIRPNITKPYTIVTNAQQHYLLQFDNLEFLQGLRDLVMWLGQDPSGYLQYLHKGNAPLEFD